MRTATPANTWRSPPWVFANELAVLVKECPLGWYDGRIIRHRDTTDTDVIGWLERLHRLAGVEV